ncbi:hypothetical protein P7C73_g2744, partial [Tremellales sp. Uapishka_1]
MVGIGLVSHLSPFSLSLLGQSPPRLAAIPTLADLQKHAESIPVPSWGGAQNTPPPQYAITDPVVAVDKSKIEPGQKTSKLTKKKKGWQKMQDEPRMQSRNYWMGDERNDVQPSVRDVQQCEKSKMENWWCAWSVLGALPL